MHTREPLFPCYLFTNIDLEIDSLSSLQWTSGLRRIVAFDGAPATVPGNAIDALLRRQRELNVTTAPPFGIVAIPRG